MSAIELAWFKSSHSDSGGGNCVEVAKAPAGVLVRDSKDVTRPHLTIPATAWGAFTASAGRGDM